MSAAAVLLASGCGVPRYRVHGTVRHQGKPLARGTIIFLGEGNQTYPARTRPDGSYEAAAVPRGRVRVQADVARPSPRPQPSGKANDALARGEMKADDAAKQARRPSAPPAPPATAAALPPHYADPDRSGLAFELQGPDQDYSVDLK
jgi:hypothetical protein